MIRVTIVVREPGKLNPDYSLEFDLPALPRVGDYISVNRPDKPEPFGEDMIVRQVWWRLRHPETSGFGTEPHKIGTTKEIFVECDPATGPWSSDDWLKSLSWHHERGEVEPFAVARLSVREHQLKGSETE